MTFFKNTVSLLAVFCVIPAAFGATARVSALPTATSARMLRPGNYARIISQQTSSDKNESGANLMEDAECFDAYTECMRGSDACGSEFEECTTKTSFHGKMLACSSVLYQCKPEGIVSLFGTGATINNLATGDADAAGEIDFTYPRDESKMGVNIINAAANNRYTDSATCVKKYKSCLQRDNVCGEDFEMCTDGTSFGKLAPNCDNVLALCPLKGIQDLFGEKATARPKGSAGDGAVKEWVSDGADLAAANAVSTCYKTTDSCFLNACAKNPYRCVEGTNLSVVNTADIIGSGDTGSTISSDQNRSEILGEDGKGTGEYENGTLTPANVKKFFKSACIDTIGTNKYCYMTVNGGKSPKKTDLTDPDNQEDLFSEMYSTRKTYINAKLQTLVQNFDAKAKKACTDTIKSCAMRSCGGGSGAACYKQVKGQAEGEKSVGKSDTYKEIELGCAAIVNTDPNCRYAAATSGDDNTYNYVFNENSTFTKLFGDSDPIGAVAALDSLLATSYNDTAIRQLQKQCENVATNCVKSMCGTDYVNCYRSRTDISGTAYNTDSNAFNNSMNRLGGVLDYNVILGLCQNTVKNSKACEEHLAIAKAAINKNVPAELWGAQSVGESWLGTEYYSEDSQVLLIDANGLRQCKCSDGTSDTCADETNGNTLCTEQLYTDVNTAVTDQASATLIQNLLSGIEKEAQSIYQSKLIKQRNMCEAGGNGIKGKNDMAAGTYMWVKLTGDGKVPLDYSTQGLPATGFAYTNDIYGGFCRLRVDIKSGDAIVNEKLKNMSTRYFAVGDAFTCGSWIPQNTLKEITGAVAENAINDVTKKGQERTQAWMGVLGAIGGAVGGGLGTKAWLESDNSALGGLLKTNKSAVNETKYEHAQECVTQYGYYKNADADAKVVYANAMIKAAEKADLSVTSAKNLLNNAKTNFKDDDCSEADWNAALVKYVPSCTSDYRPENKTRDGKKVNWDCVKDGSTNDGKTHTDTLVCHTSGTTKEAKKNTAITSLDNAIGNLNELCAAVEKPDETKSKDEREKERNTRLSIASGVGAGVGAVALGVTTWRATADIQAAQNDKVKQAAIQEWMDNIGSKIKCYIGADEVGSYGDVVSTTLE